MQDTIIIPDVLRDGNEEEEADVELYPFMIEQRRDLEISEEELEEDWM